MRTFGLREKLHREGLVLLEHGRGWLVTDQGVKDPFEKLFANLDEVEAWWNEKMLSNNRLTEEEAEEFDEEFKRFVEEQK